MPDEGKRFSVLITKRTPFFIAKSLFSFQLGAKNEQSGISTRAKKTRVAEPRFGFRIGTKDRLFEFRKEWGKARIILRRIPPRCYFKRR